MSNLETLRNKVKFHVRDINITESDLDNLILQVFNDIAHETNLFKKIVGFTIHKDKNIYDFRNIFRMNEQVETELEDVTFGSLNGDQLLDFLRDPENFPDLEIIKTTFIEDDKSTFINTLDIYDNEAYSISDKFMFKGNGLYYVTDDLWLEDNDDMNCAFVAVILPNIEEILYEDLMTITACVIEGCKYYLNDTMQTATDTQVANLYFQRYYQKRQMLVDLYPTFIVSYKEKKRWL